MNDDDFEPDPDAECKDAITAILALEDYLAAIGLHAPPEDD